MSVSAYSEPSEYSTVSTRTLVGAAARQGRGMGLGRGVWPITGRGGRFPLLPLNGGGGLGGTALPHLPFVDKMAHSSLHAVMSCSYLSIASLFACASAAFTAAFATWAAALAAFSSFSSWCFSSN